MNNIVEYLDELFPNPHCELNYNKDYELLIAVMLSAQTTDKRVNMVTDILFNKYDTLHKLASADINDIVNIINDIVITSLWYSYSSINFCFDLMYNVKIIIDGFGMNESYYKQLRDKLYDFYFLYVVNVHNIYYKYYFY